MTACLLARELGMASVLVPTTPGVLSALGGLVADVKNDFILTVYAPLSVETLPQLREGFGRRQIAARVDVLGAAGQKGGGQRNNGKREMSGLHG